MANPDLHPYGEWYFTHTVDGLKYFARVSDAKAASTSHNVTRVDGYAVTDQGKILGVFGELDEAVKFWAGYNPTGASAPKDEDKTEAEKKVVNGLSDNASNTTEIPNAKTQQSGHPRSGRTDKP